MLFPFFPALAGSGFRLAGQRFALTLCFGFRKCDKELAKLNSQPNKKNTIFATFFTDV